MAALLAGTGVASAAGSTAAEGYVAPPYWAAYTHAGIALLTYARVRSSSLGSAGGPKGTETQVPVGVRIVSASGRTVRTLITLPRGYAVLAVTASEDGVAVSAGPLADIAAPTAPSDRPWQVVVSDLRGGQRVAWRYSPGKRLEAPPSLASAGVHWAAVTQSAVRGHGPDRAVVAEGSFTSAGAASVQSVKADMLPTAVAVEPNGDLGLYGMEFAGTRLNAPKFGKDAHVALIWTGRGILVPAPGGFLTVQGALVARPEAGGRTLPVGRLPKGTAVVGLTGDGEGVVFLLADRKGHLSTWSIGAAPKGLHTVLAIRPSALFLTAAGVVGVTLHVDNRRVTVTYAAVAGP